MIFLSGSGGAFLGKLWSPSLGLVVSTEAFPGSFRFPVLCPCGLGGHDRAVVGGLSVLLHRASNALAHGQADECLGVFESKGHAGDESNLGVHGFDSAVIESVFDGGQDPVTAFDDCVLQFDKGWDPGSSGPANPAF